MALSTSDKAASSTQSIVVKMLVPNSVCGSEVRVDARPDDILHLRRQLEAQTGIPMPHQKLLLSSINQLVLGDKRMPITFASCGTANSLSMVFKGAR